MGAVGWTMTLISIVDWAHRYENNRTRELKKLEWVPLPNKQDGDGYTDLLDHPNGAAHLGAWCALLQVASRCEIRGTLMRDCGKPHDISSLERMTRIPVKVWKEALPRLASIGWIKVCEIPQEGAGIPHDDAERCPLNGMEGKGREEKGTEEDTLSGTEAAPDPVDALLDQQKAERDAIPFAKIVALLNAEAGAKYNPATNATRGLIRARWNEGYRLPDFERVITSKCAQWKRDPKMVSYLRPQTLFGTKFEAYLNESSIAVGSIPCPECGLRGGNHKYDCSHSMTSRMEADLRREDLS